MVGVSIFSASAPVEFGSFEAAFVMLFYVAGGDPWPESLAKFNEDGTVDWTVAMYVGIYTIIEIWVILQVRPRGSARREK